VPQASAVRNQQDAACLYPMPTSFACSWQAGYRGVAWVQVAGELDLVTSPQFRQTLEKAQRGAVGLVVLDLRELSFIDSSGVHAILDVADDARRKGDRLLIVRGPAQVDRMFTLTKNGKQVSIFDLDPAGDHANVASSRPTGSCAMECHHDPRGGRRAHTGGLTEQVVTREETTDCGRCFSRLPDAQQCILLAFYAGFTRIEITTALARPTGTVKVACTWGLHKLHTGIEKGKSPKEQGRCRRARCHGTQNIERAP
jgi:anti-anti-sigma factor